MFSGLRSRSLVVEARAAGDRRRTVTVTVGAKLHDFTAAVVASSDRVTRINAGFLFLLLIGSFHFFIMGHGYFCIAALQRFIIIIIIIITLSDYDYDDYDYDYERVEWNVLIYHMIRYAVWSSTFYIVQCVNLFYTCKM